MNIFSFFARTFLRVLVPAQYKKKTYPSTSFLLVDDQGISDTPRGPSEGVAYGLRESFHGFSSLLNTTKKTYPSTSFLLVDDQGISDTPRGPSEGIAYGSREPFYGFSSLPNAKKKHLARGAFSLVDDQGLEPWAH